ncbi:glycoside hydrolase family 127 protein [Deminuibacter soli]|uniref:Glycoside hydrolase family 127 protein n=2 Tax=Deminuibacter soli TaxID=2291815 RepID=A0A3E1NKX5_9BACT|nr:glycoside hydrolase family 127 protein [Deminuibacter soli]
MLAGLALFCAVGATAQQRDYPIQPVAFTAVHFTDHFWGPKVNINADVTIPYLLEMCRENGRIDNFLRAAKKLNDGKMTVYPFDDTDLFKAIEGASYSLQVKKDPALEKYLDSLIAIIGAAQEPDGYLYTFRTMNAPKPHEWIGKERWKNDPMLSHELYNAGHLFDAAVAHYQATGKTALLNIALKYADLLVATFGPGKEQEYPGHQIVETGLVKLYRVTGEKKYLDLAKFFLDVRGPNGDAYHQSNKKVVDQHVAEGHAVRAAYMYSGMADIAALTGDQRYLMAIDDIWKDVAEKKLYITGGIGATGNGEAFGGDYDLPNMSAYAETCASIANVYWNNRMFLLHGDAKYIDVLERTLYNGVLAGVSLSGNRFFYPNPLASMGQHERSAWFDCACCISSMSRFLPSVAGYVYAQDNNNLYINLFASNKATLHLSNGSVSLHQQTEYPWQGRVAVTLDTVANAGFTLRIRIPGWVKEQPVPGNLYRFAAVKEQQVPVTINGHIVAYKEEKGYAVLQHNWKNGDVITIDFPMQVQKVIARDAVKADAGRFAFQYGPVVYCLESKDNADSTVQNITVDTASAVQVQYVSNLLNGVTTLTTNGTALTHIAGSEAAVAKPVTVTAIPYYAWCNRGAADMEVWIPYRASLAVAKPLPAIASKSRVTVSLKNKRVWHALNDQYVPASSADNSGLYLHFWPAKDTTEWAQYDFDKPYTISQSKVYWYDDGPWGGCRLPASWKLYYKKDGTWVPVSNTTPYNTQKDQYNAVQFQPVTTTALRLEIQLPQNNSSGIHEWSVE